MGRKAYRVSSQTAGLPKYHVISVARFFCAHFRGKLISAKREHVAIFP